jgi:hypothetical protein
MPLCPQITNTPITVTQTADFTVSSVLPVVAATTTQLAEVEVLVEGKAEIYYQTTAPVGAGINENDLWYDTDDGNKPYVFRSGAWVSAQDGSIATAQSAANTALANAATANAVGVAAQTTANTALANAATAFTAATASLQPSANTIVNASNQITAINGNGITVYSGASPSSGARVVLNSAGLAGFNSGGSATFSVSASTGAAVFSGSVTGATITASTMNIGGNAIIDAAGLLTATGATITGTITTNNITVTGGTLTIGSKFSVTSLGVLTATDGVFTGTITSTNATITGGSFTVGAAFSISTGGFLTATGAQIGPWYFGGGFISSNSDGTGNRWSASSGVLATTSLTISAASGVTGISLLNGANILTGGGNITASGGTISASTGTITTQTLVSTGTLSISGTSTMATINAGDIASSAGTITTGTNTSSSTSQTTGVFLSSTGAVIGRRDNQIALFAHRYNASGTSELIRLVYNGSDAGGITTTSGGVPAFRNASDYRLKQNIQSFDSAASIVKQINLRSFEFIKDPEEPQVGFIAHELAEVLPALVMGEKDAIDEDGNPAYQSILATNLIPYLTGALKEAILRIEALEGE